MGLLSFLLNVDGSLLKLLDLRLELFLPLSYLLVFENGLVTFIRVVILQSLIDGCLFCYSLAVEIRSLLSHLLMSLLQRIFCPIGGSKVLLGIYLGPWLRLEEIVSLYRVLFRHQLLVRTMGLRLFFCLQI